MQTKPDFNQDSQIQQLNNDVMPAWLMTDTMLVDRFLAHHQAGEFAQAKPFLVELVNRLDKEEADNER